jgi:hypothetical protein
MAIDISSFSLVQIRVLATRDVNTVGVVWIGKTAIQYIFYEYELIVIEAFLRCHFTSRVDGTCLKRKMAHVMSREYGLQLDHFSFSVTRLDCRS